MDTGEVSSSGIEIDIDLKGAVNKGYDVEDDFVTDDDKIKHQGREPLTEDEEELILSKLREVVRKCTHSDPNQRPTADEVLQILQAK